MIVMINSLLYVSSFILLVTEITLYPKKEKKAMLLTELSLAFITVLCYGVVVAQVYSVLEIAVNIQNISISYIATSVLLGVALLKKRKIQKLYFDRWQFFCVILFSIIFVLVELKTFSYELRASFCNNIDPLVHLEMAMKIVRKQVLGRMPFAPFHNAMMIEIMSPLLPEHKYYKAFILADSLHYYFELIFFYSLTLEISKRKVSKYLAPAITLLYWLGYPLYSYVVGNFVYWSWGVILCGYVVYLVKQVIGSKGNWLHYLGIVLGIIGVLQCYMLFIPMLMVGLLVMCYPIFHKQIVKNRKVLIGLGCGMLVFILLIMVAIYTYFGKSGMSGLFAALQLQGGIYFNLGEDFFLTLPIIMVYIVYKKEKKQKDFYLLFLIGISVCMVFILMLRSFDIISAYYFCKYFYVIWFFWWVVILQAIDEIDIKQEARRYVKIYIMLVAIAYISCFGRIGKLVKMPNEGVFCTTLYTNNLQCLDKNYEQYKYSSKKMKLFQDVKENLVDKGLQGVMVNCEGTNRKDELWYRNITGEESINYEQSEWKKFMEQDAKYDFYVIMKESELYMDNADYFNQYTIVFENEEGIVIQR